MVQNPGRIFPRSLPFNIAMKCFQLVCPQTFERKTLPTFLRDEEITEKKNSIEKIDSMISSCLLLIARKFSKYLSSTFWGVSAVTTTTRFTCGSSAATKYTTPLLENVEPVESPETVRLRIGFEFQMHDFEINTGNITAISTRRSLSTGIFSITPKKYERGEVHNPS